MGARWLVGGRRRLGKATSSVALFFEEVIRLGSQVRLGGRWLPVEAYDFDREEIGGCGVRVVHVSFEVDRLHDGITADPSCLFLYSFHTAWVKHSVYVVVVALVSWCGLSNPNL